MDEDLPVREKIVYPMHGAGVIESIEERNVLGKKQMYYIMRMPAGGMTAMIPIQGCDDIGVRFVISREEAEKVLEAFKNAKVEHDSNWNKRHRENMTKSKSGDIYQVVDVVKELMYRDREKGLSTSERKMLNSAKQIMVSELVLSSVAGKNDIENIITDTVEELF